MHDGKKNLFFEEPILNSPYEYPMRHWELDETGQPTQKINNFRRPADFITPIPQPKHQKGMQQGVLYTDALVEAISSPEQEYHKALINEVREKVNDWRKLPSSQWRVTPETASLLRHWREYEFSGIRPFFCQVEAVETAIWLSEVAPQLGKSAKKYLEHVESANTDANPDLINVQTGSWGRLALKLATGAGKTTVMAMLIAWQTINAVRNPRKKQFSKGFLIVAPGITIKDRLRVLKPNDPDSYYASREIVPTDMLQDLQQARIVITNYHAFKLREKLDIAKGTRSALEGWRGETLLTQETEGEMLQRVLPELMNLKNIVVFNDEAHHCYREKPNAQEEIDETLQVLKGAEKTEAKKEVEQEREAARLWISGLEILQRKIGIVRIFDLSATPFFLRGSGYVEGALFPWTLNDFSLMDAIECGIVKLPRVPVAENIPNSEAPVFRNLWDHIKKDMPKKGRGNIELDPLALPIKLQTALDALYGHYAKIFHVWDKAGISVPPCFIIVCNNTATSKLVYEYIAGFHRKSEEGDNLYTAGRLELFRNFDEQGVAYARPRTLLIDSLQLESGEGLDATFREAAKDEIQRFTREIMQRGGAQAAALQQGKALDESLLLREVMNTVGKSGQLGDSIRCVVSVSMLTEGWDANTVTHVLGVRAFGTQLLCEQVIGRALRRQSYELNEAGLFNVEYSDVLGIPFDFTATPQIVSPPKPRETIHVHAVRPERDSLEITYPRVTGYRAVLPKEKLSAQFTQDSIFELTPNVVGPSKIQTSGIVGAENNLNLNHLESVRFNTILMHLTRHLLMEKWRDLGEAPKLYLFGQLKRITHEWLTTCLRCSGGTFPAQILYRLLADEACNRITDAILRSVETNNIITAVLDPYNPKGSTRHVNFTTSKQNRWKTSPVKSHVNWAILDSDWEAECCRVIETHPQVRAYVKNQNLGFEVPYKIGSEAHRYIPDFIVLIDDGHGEDDLLHLVLEVKGYRGEDAKDKKSTMENYWVPSINQMQRFGRWAFAELCEVYQMEPDFKQKVMMSFSGIVKQNGE